MTSFKRSPVTPSQAASELLRRRNARRSLLHFTTYTFSEYQTNWHHELLCSHLDRLVAGDIRRLLVFLPPRHGKSELTSRRLPAYIHGVDPDASIISTSYSADLASAMNRDVQRIIDSPEYRRLFPGTQLFGKNIKTVAGGTYLRNSEIFEIVRRKGVYKSAGVGGGITGRGGKYLLIDDPIKNREEADSPVVREKVWEWYTSTLYTRKTSDARILLTMTRWNIDDLAARLIRKQEETNADQWAILRLPAMKDEQSHPDDPREMGEALWPDRYPLSELEKIKANSIYDWSALYQQDPVPEGGTEWPSSFFDWDGFWFAEWPPLNEFNVRVVALDPSKGKESKTSDWQAIIKYGRHRSGIEYVEADLAKRPMVAERLPDDTAIGEGMVEAFVQACHEHKPHAAVVEENQFQSLLKIPIRSEAHRRKMEVPLKGIENTEKKETRIRRLGPPFAEKKIRCKLDSPGTRLLVDQCRMFPIGEHDDGPDGLEMARRIGINLFNKGKVG